MKVKELIKMLQSLENQEREIKIPLYLGSKIRFLSITGVSEMPNSYSLIDWEGN